MKPEVFLLAEASARDGYYMAHDCDAAYDWTVELGRWAWAPIFGARGSLRGGFHEPLAAGATPPERVFRFLDNNDTGERFVTRHGPRIAKVASTMMHTLPGVELVFTGEEVCAEYEPYEDPPPERGAADRSLRAAADDRGSLGVRVRYTRTYLSATQQARAFARTFLIAARLDPGVGPQHGLAGSGLPRAVKRIDEPQAGKLRRVLAQPRALHRTIGAQGVGLVQMRICFLAHHPRQVGSMVLRGRPTTSLPELTLTSRLRTPAHGADGSVHAHAEISMASGATEARLPLAVGAETVVGIGILVTSWVWISLSLWISLPRPAGSDAMTPDIIVRRAEPEDFAAVQAIYADPRAQADTLQLPFPSLDLWRQRLQTVDPNAHVLVACVDREVVGQLQLYASPHPRRRHVGDFGMGVRDDWQGRGVGTALLRAALDMADRWLQLQRVELQVYADNAAAITLYRRHGFVEEGRHRDYAFRDGVFVDALTMARLRPGT